MGRQARFDIIDRLMLRRTLVFVVPVFRHIALALALFPSVLLAQDLSPRAYVITPVHSNAVILVWSYYNGSLDFNGVIPIANASGSYSVPVLSIYHSFSFFGRSANVTASLPYGVGNFQGDVGGVHREIYRSGLADSVYRFSVNLKGGQAMSAPQFVKWKQRTLLGVSLKVVAPTGQYDSARLINWGANRWAFKPELGYSQRWGRWILDGYGGAWFFSTNAQFYNPPGSAPQSQKPIAALEGHLSYDIKPFLWFSVDGNFWYGGVTAISGIPNPNTRATNSRIGATGSFPVAKHQTIKVSFSNGTYIRFGGDYKNLSLAWQYSWLGRPN
jgi:hypothetical protein